MTNNPTIDGVSRAKLEQALKLAAVFDDGSDGADAESAQGVVGILRALLDAPAVERQEMDGPISELEVLRATCKQLEEFRDKTVQGWLTTRPACFAMKSMIERIQAKKGQTHSVYGFPEDGYDLPLFASPPAPVAVALTDEQIAKTMEAFGDINEWNDTVIFTEEQAVKGCRACLNKVKELNQ